MPTGKFIAYYRVSTARQGESGLGLEAQKQAVMQYLNGGDWQILAEYTEVESGKRNDRPKLAEAIAACKRLHATLILAKIDRLARNVHFVSGLMESGVEFVAVDNPNANKLMIHMLAAFAEHEREQISKRTIEALAAAKRRGVQLGKHGATFLAPHNHVKAMAFAEGLAPQITAIKEAGHTTVRAIRDQLNSRAILPAGGVSCKWHLPQVHRLLKRLEVGNL